MRTFSLALALALVAIGACVAVTVGADDDANAKSQPAALTVDDIVQRTNYVSYYQGADGRAKVSMTIVDAGGGKRSRQFTILRRDGQPAEAPEGEKAKAAADRTYTRDQKFYVYFHLPADVNRMAFLVHKHVDKPDDRWLYLPALDLVKRISSADKRTSFVGSHFFYEDVSGRNIADDTHKLVQTTKDYYVLENIPKKPKDVEFASYKMWIHRKTFLVVQTSYYDKDGKEYRRYNARQVKTIQGFPTVTASRMTDLRDKSYTDMTYTEVKYDIDVPDDIFKPRYLRMPPEKYLN